MKNHPDPPIHDDDATPLEQSCALIIHGLLHQLALERASDPSLAQEARVSRVMRSLSQPAASEEAPPRRTRTFRVTFRFALAAMLLIGVAGFLAIISISSHPSAQAEVLASAAALRSLPDRRYDVHMQAPDDADVSPELRARIDSRLPGLMVIHHYPPSRGEVIVGTDELGPWAIEDSGIARDGAERAWPPWTIVDGERLAPDSLDRLLDDLPRAYTLDAPERRTLAGSPRELTYVKALRADRGGPEPNSVELWIDPDTKLVERVELRWDEVWKDLDAGLALQPERRSRAPTADRPGPARWTQRHRPPRAIVFARVPDARLDPDWFTPQRHLQR